MPVKTIKKMPRVTRDHVALVLVCLGLGTFGGAGAIGLNRVSEQADRAVTQETLEANCEEFGNPLREGMREFFENELERTEHPDPKVLEQFGLTPTEAKELSVERIKELKYNINVRFKDVPCSQVYEDE